ncbi:MAG: serine/threonine protein kinase [Planctomycetaceae bacterium]|nr:serine/threonine protein kinase [Planctomycetaceae bacterium]
MPHLLCPDCRTEFPDTDPACPECGCPAEAASPALSVPDEPSDGDQTRILREHRPGMRVAGRYELEDAIVLEATAEIWLARDLTMDDPARTDAVLRFLPPQIAGSVGEAGRMRETVEAVRRLHHPHILALRDLVQDGDDCVLVMDRAPGHDLTERRSGMPGGRIPYEESLRLCREAAEALDYAHAAGVLHRDVRPHNIVCTDSGAVVVRNFGVTADIRGSMHRTGFAAPDTVEARLYMAPELWDGKPPRAASDQFALAVVFCELVSGKTPFADADPARLTARQARESFAIPAGIPAEAIPALRRALAPDPEERFLSCLAMVDGLEGLEALEVAVEKVGGAVPVVVAEWLAAAPIGLDDTDAEGRTILHYALADGRDDVAAWLRSDALSGGADR